MKDDALGQIETQHLIAFSGDQPKVAGRIEIEGPRTIERRSHHRGTLGSRTCSTRAGKRVDGSSFTVNPADHVIANVGNKEITGRTELKADGELKGGHSGGTLVARVTGLSRSSDGRQHASSEIQSADRVVAGIGQVEISIGTEPNLMGVI